MAARGTLREMVNNWKIGAGLAVMYLWTWFLYWGGALSLRGYTMELVNARWAANVAICALACGLTAFGVHRWSTGFFMGRLHLAGPLCGFVGTVLSLWLVFTPPAGEAAFIVIAVITGLFTGAGEGFLLCFWCTVTSSFGARLALVHNVAALAGGGMLFLICNLMPSVVSVAISLICPVIGYYCAVPYVGLIGKTRLIKTSSLPDGLAKTRSDGVSHAGGLTVSGMRCLVRVIPPLFDRSVRMLLSIAFVFGFSCGFINASFEVVPKSIYWVSCWGVVVGTILAAVLTVVTAFILKLDAWQLTFQTALPLMAASYLMFPYEIFWYVGPGVHMLGYQYFFITFWSLLGSRQLCRDVPAGRLVSLGLFMTEVGAALGLCLWHMVCAGIDSSGLRLMSSVAALCIVLVAVCFERPRFGWGSVRPGVLAETVRGEARTLDEILERMCADYGLSPREKDVCALLCRGRNRQFVSNELGISLETAKTHVTNVYRKMGIHSQQELLDVLEKTRDVLEREHFT